MQRLYEAMARKFYAKPWEAMTSEERHEVVSDASSMCEAWERDTVLRDSYAGSVETVDLIAEQYRVAQQIIAVEEALFAGLSTARH